MDSKTQSAVVVSKHQWKLSRCRLRNHQRKCFNEWPMDSTAQTAPVASKIIIKTASTGDAWIWQRNQPCGLRTSTKTKSLGTSTIGNRNPHPMNINSRTRSIKMTPRSQFVLR
jgi:hypothetical protein